MQEESRVNIGVVGRPDMGKTTFIKCLCEQVGTATQEPTAETQALPYVYRMKPNVYLWDLPSVVTPEPKTKEVWEHEDVKKCDFFLILSDNRPLQQDLWVAKSLETARKLFCFVRTKMDLELEAKSTDGVKIFWERIISDKFTRNVRLFLTSSTQPSMWDMPKLLNILAEDITDLKRGGWLSEIDKRPQESTAAIQRSWSSKSTTLKGATLSATGSANESKLDSASPPQSENKFMDLAIAALSIGKEEQDKIRSLMRGQKFADIPEELRKRLDAWEETKISVGVVGRSGSGKSTFINTIRGLKPSHELAAPVGTTETTIKPAAYPHPTNGNVLLWDLPGVGTPRFPRDSYLEAVDFHSKDFFIIITSKRFSEDDAWLAKEALSRNKNCYFVRTKLDEDAKNEFDDYKIQEEFTKKKFMTTATRT